jgi:hypothetical protein
MGNFFKKNTVGLSVSCVKGTFISRKVCVLLKATITKIPGVYCYIYLENIRHYEQLGRMECKDE